MPTSVLVCSGGEHDKGQDTAEGEPRRTWWSVMGTKHDSKTTANPHCNTFNETCKQYAGVFV